MVYVNEMKLTLGTIMMIGQDLDIENKYSMVKDPEGIDKYVEEVMDQTDKLEEENAYNMYDQVLEGLREDGRLIEEE